MDKQIYDDKINSLSHAISNQSTYIRWLIIANVVLGCILGFNYNREKIILTPQVAPEYRLFVTNNQVSDAYLASLSRNVLDLLLNVTPENIQAQQQAILQITTPKLRPVLQDKLDAISSNLKQNNLSQNFYIQSIRVIQGQNIVFIKGNLYEYINGDSASTTEQMYKLTFSVNNYNVVLDDISLAQNNDELLRGQ